MLFGPDERPGVLSGQIALVHRRWRMPRVFAGRTYRTNVDRIVIDDVQELDSAAITDADAIRAGKADADAVHAALRGEPAWSVFRIVFHLTANLGRETAGLKLDVRKLKNLGLTRSLEIGYRLAPRGSAYLRWLS